MWFGAQGLGSTSEGSELRVWGVVSDAGADCVGYRVPMLKIRILEIRMHPHDGRLHSKGAVAGRQGARVMRDGSYAKQSF